MNEVNGWYEATVKIKIEDDNGGVKWIIEPWLVQAVSVTDAEASIHKEWEEESNGLEIVVTKVAEKKISKILSK